jgi:integrase
VNVQPVRNKHGEITSYKATAKWHGMARYFTRQTELAAQLAWARAVEDFQAGREPYDRYVQQRPARVGQTLRQWSVVWLAAQDVEESSRAKMQGHLTRDVLPAFGDAVLDQGMSRITVQSWLTGLSRRKRQRTGKPLSPSSVSNIWSVMAPMCAAAVAEGLLERDPCAGLKAPKVPHRRDARHALTPAQVVALSEEMARPRPRKRKGGHLTKPYTTAAQVRAARLTLALAWTGCRWSEQGGLRCRPADVQLMRRPAPAVVVADDGPIKTTGKRGGRYHGQPKSEAGRRAVELVRPLADLYAEQMAHGLPYVWATRGGTAHHYEDYRQEFKRAAKALGHAEWTVHDLRHSHATWLKGCDRTAVKERLGHEGGDVTDGYTHVEAADRVEILRVLGGLWDQAHAVPVAVAR